MMTIEEKIKKKSLEIGFDLVGITNTDFLAGSYEVLKERKDNNKLPDMLTDDLKLLVTPEKHLPGSRSIVSLAMSYALPDVNNTVARISPYARGLDYHRVMKEKLGVLSDYIQNIKTGVKTKVFTDTVPLLEREIARKAGLGWIGKNTNLINDKYGSYLFLGEIITSLELKSDRPHNNKCNSCKICLDKCPSGALEKPYLLSPGKCISQLTQQRGMLSVKERKLIGINLWGCGVCQEVCPYNQDIPLNVHHEYRVRIKPELIKILSYSRKNFPEKWYQSALSWRGMRIIQRNALIVIGNTGDRGYIDIVIEKLTDSSPIIRAYAVWAAAEIDFYNSKDILHKLYKQEKDKRVIRELKRIL